MGKETGFLEIEREDRAYADPKERCAHYKEFIVPHGRARPAAARPRAAWIAASRTVTTAAR